MAINSNLFKAAVISSAALLVASCAHAKPMEQKKFNDLQLAKVGDSYFGSWVTINWSKGGEKTLYINEYSPVRTGTCKSNGLTKAGDDVVNVDGVNVKMFYYCRDNSDSKAYTLYYTPQTYKGQKYVTNRFLNNKSVKVDLVGSYNLSAIGFTKAWNALGNQPI